MKWRKSSLFWFLFGLLAGVMVGVLMMTLVGRTRPAPIVIERPLPTSPPPATATPGMMQIYVNGAVVRSAVYELPPGSLVEAAIAAAGGFTAEANTAVVNLAQPLVDGAQVYVPLLSAAAATPATVVNQGGAETASTASAELVNINTATAAELDALPGIGPSIAQAIITYREENGRFPTIDAITWVSGIGEAKFAQLEDLITVAEE